MARKKIIFIIVEGPSDETALALFFTHFYANEYMHIEVLRYDITTKSGVNSSNILSAVGKVIKNYAQANHFKNSDFQEIIHITDTDGAFIENTNIIEDEKLETLQYSITEIRTPNKANIEKRNQQKSTNLAQLSTCHTIWKIPYRIFYMSCNLDHVLYNKLNSSPSDKKQDAYTFAKKYKEDIQGFITFVSQSDFAVPGNYSDTWKYIKQDLHSLERHTNLGLCFTPSSEE